MVNYFVHMVKSVGSNPRMHHDAREESEAFNLFAVKCLEDR